MLFHESLQRPHLPIFVITALARHAVAGADKFAAEFFEKPLDLDELIDAVRRRLRGSDNFYTMKRKRGRPKLALAARQAKQTAVRLQGAERTLLDLAAHQREMSLSDWMRKILLSAARRQLRATGWKTVTLAADRSASDVRRHFTALAS